jgi:hypothetical protein
MSLCVIVQPREAEGGVAGAGETDPRRVSDISSVTAAAVLDVIKGVSPLFFVSPAQTPSAFTPFWPETCTSRCYSLANFPLFVCTLICGHVQCFGESSDSCHPILVLPTVLSWHFIWAISISQYVTASISMSLHVYISRGRFPFRFASLLRFPFRCMCTLIVAPSLSMSLMNVQMLSAESNPVLLVRTTFIFATLGLVKGTQPVLLVPSRPLYQLQHTVYVNRGRVSTPFDPLWSHRCLPVFC